MKDVNGAVIRSVSRCFNGGVTETIKSIMSAIISLNRPLIQSSPRSEEPILSIFDGEQFSRLKKLNRFVMRFSQFSMIVNLSQRATQNVLKASGYPANEQWRISSSIRFPFQQPTIPSSLFDTQSNIRKLCFTVLVRVFWKARMLMIHIFAFCLAEIHSFSTVAEIMRMTNLVGRDRDFFVDLFDRFLALVRS
jgi:hypothetical protein